MPHCTYTSWANFAQIRAMELIEICSTCISTGRHLFNRSTSLFCMDRCFWMNYIWYLDACFSKVQIFLCFLKNSQWHTFKKSSFYNAFSPTCINRLTHVFWLYLTKSDSYINIATGKDNRIRKGFERRFLFSGQVKRVSWFRPETNSL